MINKIKEWGGLVALIAIVLFFVFTRSHGNFGTVSPSDVTATNFTEVTASNGMYIGAGGMTINAGGLTVTGGITSGGIAQTPTQVSGISTTTSTCVIAPPTATSTFQFSYTISSTSPNTTVLALGTSTNAFATTSASKLVSQLNTTNQIQPISYTTSPNMFATPLTSVILYYTNGTTAGNAAQQELGTCSLIYTAL